MTAPGKAGAGVNLADQIIERGPVRAGDFNPFRNVTAAQFNELREELIELRAIVAKVERRGRGLPSREDAPEQADCGCPVVRRQARIEEHTAECGQRQAAQRLAASIARDMRWEDE